MSKKWPGHRFIDFPLAFEPKVREEPIFEGIMVRIDRAKKTISFLGSPKPTDEIYVGNFEIILGQILECIEEYNN